MEWNTKKQGLVFSNMLTKFLRQLLALGCLKTSDYNFKPTFPAQETLLKSNLKLSFGMVLTGAYRGHL